MWFGVSLTPFPFAPSAIADTVKYIVETGHKMADRYDSMAHMLRVYGEDETPGIKACLASVTLAIEQVQDYSRAQVWAVGARLACGMRV